MLTVKEMLNELIVGIESLEISVEMGDSLSETYTRALIYSISFKCPVYFDFNDLKRCVNAAIIVNSLIADLNDIKNPLS